MPETQVRRTVLPPIDSLKERFGGFAKSPSSEDEYAVTVYCSLEDLEALLDDLGFSPSLLSALKVRFDGNVEDGSWVRRDSPLADEQLHVVVHDHGSGDGIDVYAHREPSKLTHPVAHYRTIGYDAEAGIEQVRTLLEHLEDPPRYEIRPRYSRFWGVTLHALSYVSTPAAVRLGRTIEDIEDRLEAMLPTADR